MKLNLNSLEGMAQEGRRIYAELCAKEYDSRYFGKYVAINLEDNSATVGDTVGLFYVARIDLPGGPATSFAQRNFRAHRLH